jgi:hypothetical protein
MERGFDGDSGGMTPLTWYLMWELEKGGKIRRGHIREGKGYGVCYSCENHISCVCSMAFMVYDTCCQDSLCSG